MSYNLYKWIKTLIWGTKYSLEIIFYKGAWLTQNLAMVPKTEGLESVLKNRSIFVKIASELYIMHPQNCMVSLNSLAKEDYRLTIESTNVWLRSDHFEVCSKQIIISKWTISNYRFYYTTFVILQPLRKEEVRFSATSMRRG